MSRTDHVTQLADWLEQAILAGEFQPGDLLPSEREISTQRGVSRSVVREALGRLASLGLVRSVHGSGTRVEAPSSRQVTVGYQRLADPVGTHLWHLRLAREARANQDAFALAFHLEPLLLTSFTQRGARPRDAFPLWAKRPPLTGAPGPAAAGAVPVTADELRGLHERLSRRLDAAPEAWEAWAGRGWCRHLLGDLPGATADLQKAIELCPDA